MISRAQFCDEFAELAAEAGITDTCELSFPARLEREHRRNRRRYAEVEPATLRFYFAPQVLELPRAHRRGLIMHELGHVLAPHGSERDADRAAEAVFGEQITYDCRWPGKGLQCATPTRRNPPFQGWRKKWWRKKLPNNLYKVCYRTKTDALNVFLDHNRMIVDDYGGEDMVHSRASFDAINNRYDIPAHREVDTIAKAVWWALPGPGPWCLENIDVEMLNETAPAIYNQHGLVFRLPDHIEEAKLLEQEAEYWAEMYGDVGYPDDEVPF